MDELRLKNSGGITVTAVSFPSPDGVLSISGIAHDRISLNVFKKSLVDSSMFIEVNLPLNNLDKKEAIPFSITFKLKDPASIIDHQAP